MSGAVGQVEGALIATLAADAPLAALLGAGERVWTIAPPDQPFPFVTINHVAADAWDTSSEYGKAHRLDVHAWSRATGPAQANAILDRVEIILRTWAPTMAAHRVVLARLASRTVGRDPDGATIHGVASFVLLTEET